MAYANNYSEKPQIMALQDLIGIGRANFSLGQKTLSFQNTFVLNAEKTGHPMLKYEKNALTQV